MARNPVALRALAVAALVVAPPAFAQAQAPSTSSEPALSLPKGQAFPARSVRMVVPTSAGGATDTFARALAPRLAEAWGQAVIIENRPGANQIIGSEAVAKSAPDGYTLLVSEASSFVMNPHLYKNLPYDALNGFTPITAPVRFPWVVAVHPSVPVNTFQELVAVARANPGTLSYGSFGLGSSGHISVDYLKKLLGLDIVHVPYKGGGPAVADLLAGQISMMMVTPLLVEPHARAGKLRLIAAATAQRIAALPDLPTIAESGVPGYEAGTWLAFVGPAGVPRDIVARIYADTFKVLNDPAFREQHVTRQWFEVIGQPPEQFAAFLRSEYERWGRLIRLSGVSVE
jgi:tripartite-type tricarboxylate transporter receptor subunit TctC